MMVSPQSEALAKFGQWRRLDHLARDFHKVIIFAIAFILAILVILLISVSLDGLDSMEVIVLAVFAAIWSVVVALLLSTMRARLLVRSRRSRREFHLAPDEAQRRLDSLAGLEREAAERSWGMPRELERYRATEHRAVVLLQRATVGEMHIATDWTAVEVEPQEGEADLAGLKELLDGALNGEAQG